MPNRHGSDVTPSEQYKYGYQGSEKDGEVHGESYTTQFRQLDTRIGRWLSVDPLKASFPWQSPYNSMDNSPLWKNDQLGLWGEKRAGRKRRRAIKRYGKERVSEVYYNKHNDEWGFNVTNKENGKQENEYGTSENGEFSIKADNVTGMYTNKEYRKFMKGDRDFNNYTYNGVNWEPFGFVFGETLYVLGQPSIPTRGKFRNSTKGTSRASRFFRNSKLGKVKMPKNLNKLIPKRAFGAPLRSPTVGGTLGRSTPILGRTLSYWAVISYINKTARMIMNPDAPQSQMDWRDARLHSTSSIGMYHTGPLNPANPQSSVDLKSKYGTDELDNWQMMKYIFGF